MIARIWRAMLAAASVKAWAMILGAIPMTATVWVIIGIVADRAWGQSVLQLNVLANIGYGSLLIIALVFVALTGTSIAANVGKGGAGVSLKPDDDDEAKTVNVEGQVTISEQKP